jgi:nitrate reductase gamma subunit
VLHRAIIQESHENLLETALGIGNSAKVSGLGLFNRFSKFWRDFNAVNCWRFPELPPSDLLNSLNLNLSGINQAEFFRTQWMWDRKPKSLLGDGLSAYLLLFFIGLLLLLVPFVGIILSPIWSLAMLLMAVKDSVRLVRWRRDYESSVIRLTGKLRKAN